MDNRLQDKVALVTGGARGIGWGIAEQMAQAGAHIAIADVRDDLAKESAATIRRQGRKSQAYHCDVSKSAEVRALFASVLRDFGDLDVLVNNAGVMRRYSILEMEEDEWDRVLGINLKGVFLCTREAARYWVANKRRGKIINVSSTSAELAGLHAAHYAASKGGVKMFTRAVALDLAKYGINVTAVGPGGIKTDITGRDWSDPQVEEAFRSMVPMGRVGLPQDIGKAVVFLASDDADFITGHTVYVDGGRAIGMP